MLTGRLDFLCQADCKAVVFVRQTPVPHSEQRHVPQAHLDRPADAWAGYWQLHPRSPQQGPGLRMQMPLSREELWVDFILRALGTGIGEGACLLSPNCSKRDATSNHLILCHPLLLLSSIIPSIRAFSNGSVLSNRRQKYWSFTFSIRPSNEYSGLISFRMDWLDLLADPATAYLVALE